jgi:predicted acylesterase/phospholipase RssA
MDAKTARNEPHGTHQPKRALVLDGGGVPGALYEIGVLTALDDSFRGSFATTDFDLYVGTSAGAIVGAFLANGVQPRQMFTAIAENQPSPLNFGRQDVFRFSWQEWRHCLKTVIRETLRHFSIFSRQPQPATPFLERVQETLPPGAFSIATLEEYLCTTLTRLHLQHYFPKLTRPLYVTAMDIDTGERIILGEGEFQDVHVCTAVAASSALPLFFRPIRIKDRDLVDGAVGSRLSVDIALDHGVDLVLNINPFVPIENDRSRVCLPTTHGYCARITEKGVGWVASQAFRLLMAGRKSAALQQLRGAKETEAEIYIIEPQGFETTMFMHNVMDFGARSEILNYGYHCGVRFLRERGRELQAALQRQGIPASLTGLADGSIGVS